MIQKIINGIRSVIIRLVKEPLVKITCTLIAAVIGGWLGATFQENSWREQYNLSMIESDRQQAEEIFNEVSRLMDDRFYKTRRLLSAHSQHDSIKIEIYKQSLISQLEEWNANRRRMYSLIEGYYGVKYSNFFIYNIQDHFAKISNYILSPYEKNIDLDKIRIELDSIDRNIAIFNKMMLNAIKNNKIGRFCSDS